MVATESHRKSLLQDCMHVAWIAAAIEQGLLLPLDVAETLSTFMVNDCLTPCDFLKLLGIWSRRRLGRQRGHRRGLQFAVKCASIVVGAKATRMRRFRWSISANELTKTIRKWIFSAGFALNSFYCDEDKHSLRKDLQQNTATGCSR